MKLMNALMGVGSLSSYGVEVWGMLQANGTSTTVSIFWR